MRWRRHLRGTRPGRTPQPNTDGRCLRSEPTDGRRGQDHGGAASPETGRTHVFVYEDDPDLIAVVERRGYVRNTERASDHLVYDIGDTPSPELPDGYRLFSMADECDVDKRREIFGRSFNHEDPREWPSRFAYEELMRAPDYRPELDLVLASDDDTYAACCIGWYDERNRVAHLEPLGTHPDHRGQGLASVVLLEAIRRLEDLGATYMPMTGGFDPFYKAFGFRKLRTCYAWERTPDGST